MSARRRDATVVPLASPADWPSRATDLGGDMERIAGHLRGLVYALREFDVVDGLANQAGMTPEESECRSWLYEALLDAVDHEQDRLQALAPLVAQQARR